MLHAYSKFIAEKLGLDFSEDKQRDLERGIPELLKQFRIEDPLACLNWLEQKPLTHLEMDVLSSCFTIGETYFFREKASFQVLEKDILPNLIARRRTEGKFLRLWSAACSSGEEAYSLAILLHRLIQDIETWNITLLATDINIQAIAKMKMGIYGDWSFRDLSQDIKKTYFKKTPTGRYQIISKIKKIITPLYLNLVEDAYPSLLNNTNGMDIIFCRNVLMYFVPELANRVIHKLTRSLTRDGFIFFGVCEHPMIEGNGLQPKIVHGSTFFEKGDTLSNLEAEPGRATQIPPTLMITDALPLLVPEPQFEPKILKEKSAVKGEEKPIEETQTTSVETLTSQARILANQGKLETALDVVNQAIEINKVNAQAHYLKALILQELSLLSESVAELKKAIYLDPDFVLPYFSLGNIAILQGKPKEAKRNFDIVLSLIKPYDPKSILPGSEEFVVERMREVIHSMNMNQPTSVGG